MFGERSASPAGAGAYTEAIDEGNKTFSLFKEVDAYFGNPILSLFASKARARRLKTELDQWYDFLYDRNRRVYYTPILSATNFKKHIRTCKGVFKPAGECLATAPWVQFVHGLGITPENNVITKRSLAGKGDPKIVLEVDGEVICHVVNMLGGDDAVAGKPGLSGAGKSYTTAIGGITYTPSCGDTRAATLRYQPSSTSEIAQPHFFFSSSQRSGKAWDPDNLLTRYELALEVGTSDGSMMWLIPSTHISRRLDIFIESLKKLRNPSHIPLRDRPVFMTPSWLHDAERVRRRASGGDQADQLLQDCESRAGHALEESARILQFLHDWIKPRQQLYFLVPGGISPEAVWEREKAHEILNKTVKSYEWEVPGTWKHDLFLSGDKVDSVLTSGPSVCIIPGAVYVLPFDSSSELWQTRPLQLEGE